MNGYRSNITGYAHILFEVSKENNKLNNVLYDLKTISLIREKKIRKLLNLPVISKKKKIQLLDSFLGLGIQIEVINLVKLLVQYDEIHKLNTIIKEFEILYQEENDVKIINATFAREISSKNYDKYIEILENKFDKFIVLNTNVDPKLIAGVKLEFDSIVIDNTVKNHLRELKKVI